MRQVTLATCQFSMTENVQENIATADRMVREAAKRGANIILLPELFERNYFCQEERYSFYKFATALEDNDAVNHFKNVAKELKVVIPVSFYEKAGTVLYNTVAMIDADGTVLGMYRKTHIPDDHFYQEKFYFTPGNTGFKVWNTAYGKVGVGICWDQWFPECARSMALMGAELILYPTAIGSEPILDTDSMRHWRTCMCGHSGSNVVPVAAANRIGLETVEPCKDNNFQKSAIRFYGSSFITNQSGEIIADGSRDKEEILTATFDLDQCEEDRMAWGLFRDRRPEMYGEITK